MTVFPTQLLRWNEMDYREQHVWAAVFASQTAPAMKAAAKADEVVKNLRELNIENTPATEIWQVAAKAGAFVEKADFDAWYRVSSLFSKEARSRGYQEPTQRECDEAYEKYDRGRAEFY